MPASQAPARLAPGLLADLVRAQAEGDDEDTGVYADEFGAGAEEEAVDEEVWLLGDEFEDEDEDDDFLSPEMRARLAALGDAREGEGAVFSAADLAAKRRRSRKLTPFHPSRGAAVVFSSGWENMPGAAPLRPRLCTVVPFALHSGRSSPPRAARMMVGGGVGPDGLPLC